LLALGSAALTCSAAERKAIRTMMRLMYVSIPVLDLPSIRFVVSI
jgi:hypothetical protein